MISKLVPAKTRVYVYGGAIRNALYRHFFGRRLPQRDYDLMVIGDHRQFVKNLRSAGFIKGKKTRVANKLVLKLPKVARPSRYEDYFWADMVLRDEGRMTTILRKRANFTINSFALPIGGLFGGDWRKRLTSLPGAVEDLKKKRLRTWVIHPIDVYAAIRFVSLGFRQPPREEMGLILEALRGIERWRFNRDTKKVVGYVGSRAKVRAIAKKLGIPFDVFDFRSVKRQGAEYER